MVQARLRDHGYVSIRISIQFSEAEEKLLRALAAHGGGLAGIPRKPTYAQVVATMVRRGLACLRDHGESVYDPEPISEKEAQSLKLNWPGKDKRKPVINSRPVNLWRPEDRRSK